MSKDIDNVPHVDGCQIEAPLVSVIVTTFNHSRYIAHALRSVFAQETTFSVELLVGDDKSTDGTTEIVRALADEASPMLYRPFLYDTNVGGHQNLSLLWREARGKYVAWIEGDDYWTDPRKLERQVAALERSIHASLCFHRCSVLNESSGRITSVYPLTSPKVLKFRHIVYGNPIMTPTVMYRRGVIDRIPHWIWSLQLGDWPLHLIHAAAGDALFLEEDMSVYRMHDKGVWSSLSDETRIVATMKVLAEVQRHVPKRFQAACNIAMQDLWYDLGYLDDAAKREKREIPSDLIRSARSLRGRLARYIRERDRKKLITGI